LSGVALHDPAANRTGDSRNRSDGSSD
jgi:hypothetical protein